MPKKILVIDDEPDIVSLIRSRLEANNYEVVFAFDGEEGMVKAKSEKPDLILLDILMPRVDGYSLVQEMKNVEEVKDIPVVILTAKDQMKDIFEQEGIKDYIVKPFKSDELLEIIKEKVGD